MAVALSLSIASTLVFATFGTTSTSTRARPSALNLDHYACYTSTSGAFKTRKVKLADQFGSGSAVVSKPVRLCAPASKNGSAVINRRAHLVCYPIRFSPQPGQHRVLVKNQFGPQTMTVIQPETLCLPSSKATTGAPAATPTNLDHYTCYTIDPGGAFQSRAVKVADQFGKSSDTVIRPVRLCAPAKKNGSKLIKPRPHLVCYQIRSAGKGRRVTFRNQFGLLKGLPGLRQWLCVPSTKTLQP